MERLTDDEFNREIKLSKKYLEKNPAKKGVPTYNFKRGPVDRALRYGGVAFFGIFSVLGVAFALDKAKDTEAGTEARNKLGLCDTGCSAQVQSEFPLPAKQDSSIELTGAIEYTLDTDGEVGKLASGNGAGLVINVDADPTSIYDNLLVSNNTPAEAITAENWFRGINGLIARGGEVGARATQMCFQELDLLIHEVQENPKVFATEDFPEAMLREMTQVYHASEFQPYTDAPVPSEFRREIVFVGGNETLVCSGKRP